MILTGVIASAIRFSGPNGDEQTFSQDTGGSLSTSAYEMKGNIWDMTSTRWLTKMNPVTTGSAGQSIYLWVARLDSGLYTVAEVLLYGDGITTVSGSNITTLTTPIKLTSGERYAFAAVRQDANHMDIIADASPNTDPNGHFVAPSNAVVRHDIGYATGTGQNVSFSSSAKWALQLTTEADS